jgi:hypothetical protein
MSPIDRTQVLTALRVLAALAALACTQCPSHGVHVLVRNRDK